MIRAIRGGTEEERAKAIGIAKRDMQPGDKITFHLNMVTGTWDSDDVLLNHRGNAWLDSLFVQSGLKKGGTE